MTFMCVVGAARVRQRSESIKKSQALYENRIAARKRKTQALITSTLRGGTASQIPYTTDGALLAQE